MIAVTALKAFVPIVAVAGGSLTLYSKSKPSKNIQVTTVGESPIEEISESVTPIVRVKPQYNFAVLQEGLSTNWLQPSTNQYKIKCKLEGSEEAKDYCALAKLPLTKPKKWIDLTEYQRAGIHSIVNKDYITTDKTIYKVRVVKALIDAWEKEPTKNLQIFKDSSGTDGESPLITLTPKLAIKNGNRFAGQMQYVVGKISNFSDTNTTSLSAENHSLQCDLPTEGDEYKNCEIYLFDNDEDATNPKEWRLKELKTPLTKAKSIKKTFHYLIKFKEPQTISTGIYPQTDTLRIKAYRGHNRQLQVTDAVDTIYLSFLSSVVLFEDHLGIDLALIL